MFITECFVWVNDFVSDVKGREIIEEFFFSDIFSNFEMANERVQKGTDG